MAPGGAKGASRGRPTEAAPDLQTTLCLICKRPLQDGPVSCVQKGIEKVISVSKDREDGLDTLLEGRNSVWLHQKCRSMYTHPKNVKSYKKEREASDGHAGCSATCGPALRSRAPTFDPKRECLLCGRLADASKARKLEACKRKCREAVHEVQTEEDFERRITESIRDRGPRDNWGQAVQVRLNQLKESDLPAAEARYHKNCHIRFLSGRQGPLSESAPGRPAGKGDELKEKFFRKLVEYIETSDECQFSLSELEEILAGFGAEAYTRRWLKEKLSQEFGNGVFFSGGIGENCIVNFTGFAQKLLYDNWYKERNSCEGEERQRVIRLAVQFILEDIRKKVCCMDVYPTADEMLSCPLPESLNYFLEKLISTREKNTEGVARKRNAIGQALMYSCRPRSFIPPLLLGLTADCHQHEGSRELIDRLHSFGFFVSYAEAKRFEFNLMVSASEQAEAEHHVVGEGRSPHFQFVFDNADWNTKTLDGHGTFHCLGGVRITTPPSQTPCAPVPRRPLPSSAIQIKESGRFGIPIAWGYSKPAVNGLNKILVKPLSSAAFSGVPHPHVNAASMDTLWMVGRWGGVPRAPSWNGYMKSATGVAGTFTGHTSGVEALPFINLDPNNLTTLYSALLFALRECRRAGTRACFVTFDQPLYSKSVEIVMSDDELRDVVIVRLGGFHLLMSFIGAIAYFMRGSGLEELLELVYASNSVKHMMNGGQYARSLRAHFLVQEAIGGLLLDKVTLDAENKAALLELHQDCLDNIKFPDDVAASVAVHRLRTSLEDAGEGAARRSRTGRLWWQYFKLVGLLRLFIRAERTGDWQLHLNCVKAMLPFFHASAHLPYAKAAHLYIQQMEELTASSATAAEEGMFTVRRNSHFWAGVSTDMVIEQDLMRPLKVQGGLTRGRGLTDSVISQWVMSKPAMLRVSAAVEVMSGVRRETSEQHVELRCSRLKRDQEDLKTFRTWLQQHSPFQDSDGIKSIATGRLGNTNVNCDRAEEVGLAAMAKMVGQSFSSLTLQRKDRVIPLSEATPKPKSVDNADVNPNLMVLRMARLEATREEKRSYLAYELARKPPSLFDAKGFMRKGNKAAMLRNVDSDHELPDREEEGDNILAELDVVPIHSRPVFTGTSPCKIVVDGGYLIHVVNWPRNGEGGEARPTTYGDVCSKYVEVTQNRFGTNVVVVFDGYGVRWSTKCEEQRRRAEDENRKPCPDIAVDEDLEVCVQRENFLSNKNNKTSLIRLLTNRLRGIGVKVKQADADADVLIAETAMEYADKRRPVSVIARDTDILLILLARADDEMNITVDHPKTSNFAGKKYNVQDIRRALGRMLNVLLVAYSMTGCDTCSAIHGRGKRTLWAVLKADRELHEAALQFLKPHADKATIAKCGEQLILSLYRTELRACGSLNEARFAEFYQTSAKKSLSLDLSNFPPTSDAAAQHSFRVFLQVQQWLGNDLNPLDWGWHAAGQTLEPVPMIQPAAPNELMALVACNCKAGCRANSQCSCRKNDLPCSPACRTCRGETCYNSQAFDEADWDNF